MSIPQRPFRGTDIAAEAQHVPAYRKLDHGIGKDNLSSRAVVPFATAAASGGTASTVAFHIDWTMASFTAGTGGAGSVGVTITHGLGRQPIGAFAWLPADSRTDVALFVTGISSWNTLTLGLGMNFGAAGTATRSVAIF